MFAEVRDHLERTLESDLVARDAAAFVLVGSASDPDLQYCLAALRESIDAKPGSNRVGTGTHTRYALAYVPDEGWLVRSSAEVPSPADRLATDLADRDRSGPVLTPASLPHDAALYLEGAGWSLASSDALERARATKTTDERERIETAQAAAGEGVRTAASVLAEATVDDGTGSLVVDDAELTPKRLRVAIDESIVAAGALPAGNTRIEPGADDGTLRPGDPIVVGVAPREPGGYYGGLARTLVVDPEGGQERRAHVAVTHAFRSSEAMLSADAQSVTAVEADLEAEIRSFGFPDPDDAAGSVTGVGLESHDPPREASAEIGPGSVVRLEAAAQVDDGGWVRIADLLAVADDGVAWLSAPSRSLEPAALLE
ncbi:M24 family metallopeptidase [Halopiger goleimassiliensis]|uniref:M24 family metallopeptidase n=1 Tax=Halopiger goleimassiliensis TaxID=1293048 RepID=UPI00067833E0|nr:M24 family metallopeptidase [Halopiger goleimassiliensis]